MCAGLATEHQERGGWGRAGAEAPGTPRLRAREPGFALSSLRGGSASLVCSAARGAGWWHLAVSMKNATRSCQMSGYDLLTNLFRNPEYLEISFYVNTGYGHPFSLLSKQLPSSLLGNI